MNGPDRRTLLARPDLADLRLQGRVRAKRFQAVRPLRCVVTATAVRRSPDIAAAQEDQLLYGELFDVLEEADGWAWGQARRDGYVGHVRLADLGPPGDAPTYRVSALRAHGYLRPEVKAPHVGLYPINALVRAGEVKDGFADAGEAGWIHLEALSPIGRFERDPAAVAERFLGAPYLWGGRDGLGVDCSGLVQQALFACGRACPRDADQQLAAFRRQVSREALRRGDLVFWEGHVGMMLDAERLLHANSRRMAVTIEPLDEVVDRVAAAGGGPPVAFRRP